MDNLFPDNSFEIELDPYTAEEWEQVFDVMKDRISTVKNSIDAYINSSRWENDLFIEEKDVMASSLSEDYIAKVTIETKTPEVAFAIEELLEGMWND